MVLKVSDDEVLRLSSPKPDFVTELSYICNVKQQRTNYTTSAADLRLYIQELFRGSSN